jgi:hypothetical protein
MKKIGIVAVTSAALLLPSLGAAGRLDGEFGIRQADAPDSTNEACVDASGDDFSLFGRVFGNASGCEVEIRYDADLPHKASAKALKGNKTEGSVKISQTIFVGARVIIREPGAGDTCDDALEMFSSNEGEVEKCKASGSVKGTSVPEPADDTVSSGRISFSCDLGEAGASLDTDLVTENIQPPSQAQFDVVVAAFEGRKDVKLANKGRLKIKMKGVPDDTPVACVF